MRKHAAVLILVAATIFGATQIAEGQTSVPATPAVHCTSVKHIYAEKNWRVKDPSHGEVMCDAPRRVRRATIRHFHEYQEYRRIATMKCLPGPEGWFVPNPGSCTTLRNESGLSWWAVNSSSGAEWVYQLLGGHTIPARVARFLHTSTTIYGGPRPNTFHNRLINHEVAGQLSRSAWTAAG